MRSLMISASARSLTFDRPLSPPTGILVSLFVLGLVLAILQSEVGGGSTSSLTQERPAPAPAPAFVVGNSGFAHGPGGH